MAAIEAFPVEPVVAAPTEVLTEIVTDKVDIGGGEVKYTLEYPFSRDYDAATLLINGYGGLEITYGGVRHEESLRGKTALTLEPARKQKMRSAFHPTHLRHPERLPSQAVYGVMRDARQKYGQEIGFSQYDLLCHSMGGYTGSLAANHRPELVRSMTLLSSAGLDGHTLWTLGARTKDFIRHELAPSLGQLRQNYELSLGLKALYYFFRNPPRTFTEGLAVGMCDIRDNIQKLGSLGVKIAAIQAPSDRLFPLEGVRKHIEDRVDSFTVMEAAEAGHLAPQLRPAEVAQVHLDIIEAFFQEPARQLHPTASFLHRQ